MWTRASLFTSSRLSVPRCSAGLTPLLCRVGVRITLSKPWHQLSHTCRALAALLSLSDKTDERGGGSHIPAGRGHPVASQKGAGTTEQGGALDRLIQL